ncbi:MAG: tetratricopeptide repeat protein [Pseudomonadota bacterium]
MNCYEEGALLRLSAAVKVETNDYPGAVRDLETAVQRGYVPQTEIGQTYYNISQLHMSSENLTEALRYMNLWLQNGGQPNRTQKWQLAVLYHKDENNRESLRWAEEVFREDGPNAEREVYDFLIYLYDQTGQLAKKAELLETLLQRNPNERRLWDAIAGDYYQSGDQRRAFEVQKAMYLGGILQTEDELMRIVNFYNQFDVPFQAARTLEKEMNAGTISKTYERMELLANLYQVAREFERAIPVIREAAQMRNSGEMYERLGRSYAELKDWEQTESALQQALTAGGVNDRGTVWTLIGQSRYERDDTEGAVEAFRQASNAGGRGWLSFIAAERRTERALYCFGLRTPFLELENEQKACDQLRALPDDQKPEGCLTIGPRFEEAATAFEESGCADD